VKPLQRAQSIAAVGERWREVGPHGERPIATDQSQLVLAICPESNRAVRKHLRIIGPGRQGAVIARQGVGQLATPGGNHRQQMMRIEICGISGDGVAAQAVGVVDAAFAIGRQRLRTGLRRSHRGRRDRRRSAPVDAGRRLAIEVGRCGRLARLRQKRQDARRTGADGHKAVRHTRRQ
jgi:hypothetical protein